MATALGVLGGIAASPFRAAGAIAGGTTKLAGAGLKGAALAAMDVSGALPLFAVAAGVKKGITAGYKKGKELLRPIGDGAVAEDSALAAIAAAASETAKINAETEKIEAEADALTGKAEAVATTSMGGMDVEILEKIYGEVVSIRGIVGDADPESEKKELELDEAVRHKNFLKALEALGFGGKGDGKDKGPGFFGNLTDMFKGFLPTLIAGLGLAGLMALWPKISKAFEGISDAIANINEFLTDMAAFFKPLTDFLGGVDPSTLGAAAGAVKGAQRHQSRRGSGSRAAMQAERDRNKKLKKEQDKARKAKLKAQEKARLKAAQDKARLKAANDRAKARQLERRPRPRPRQRKLESRNWPMQRRQDSRTRRLPKDRKLG